MPETLIIRVSDIRRGSGDRKLRAAAVGAQKRLDNSSIEVDAGTPSKLVDGPGHRQLRTIGPVRGHCIERIRHRHYSGFQRDLLAPECIGKTTAVDPFVMRADDAKHTG